MTGRMQGKVALVTGASSGIGRATAIAFAKEGAKVVVAARNEEKLKAVVEEIRASEGEAVIAVGDASKELDCKRMVDTAVDTFGGIHVAFNNHGVFMPTTFADVTAEAATTMLDVNLKSLVFCFKYQIPAMAKCGTSGSIVVNTSSMGSRVTALPAMKASGVYAASKAGADMLMKYAAIEGSEVGVRVNSVAPGHVDTPIYGEMPKEMLIGVSKTTQLIGRPATADELAKVVLFLASDDAAMVTGSVYGMDGGWAIKA